MRRLVLTTLLLLLSALAAAQHAPGRVLVTLRKEYSHEASPVVRKAKATGRPLSGKWQRIRGGRSLIVNVNRGQEVALAKYFARQKEVEAVELDVLCPPEALPNDPLFSQQWHSGDIALPAAWDRHTGAGVIIGICDTGVDTTHPDLAALSLPGYNAYDNNTNTADVHGHGTHVAGIAAAAGNNGIGITGVLWGARLLPLRTSDPNGYSLYSNIAEAIYWASERGARVINISVGGAVNSSTINAAAEALYEKGGLVFVGSGNTGGSQSYADYKFLIAVGATDQNGNRAPFSTYGTFLDLMAPGVSIYSTKRGGSYGAGSGTSFSSPIAAGVAGLLFSATPALSPGQVREILFATAKDIGDLGPDPFTGRGKVDAYRALLLAATPPALPDDLSPTLTFITPRSGQKIGRAKSLRVEVEASDNVGVVSVTLKLDGAEAGTLTAAPYVWNFHSDTFSTGYHTFSAIARDKAGNIGVASVRVRK